MGRQIGMFFLFVGMIVVFVFVASLQLGSPEYSYCLIGLFLVLLGGVLVYRNRRTPEPAKRFRILRRKPKKKKKKEEED
jgi:uncharacterized membrane protein YfcA